MNDSHYLPRVLKEKGNVGLNGRSGTGGRGGKHGDDFKGIYSYQEFGTRRVSSSKIFGNVLLSAVTLGSWNIVQLAGSAICAGVEDKWLSNPRRVYDYRRARSGNSPIFSNDQNIQQPDSSITISINIRDLMATKFENAKNKLSENVKKFWY